MTSQTSVAVVGAGPYGLAVAARLRAAGVETHVFGDVMAFWQRNMPAGMLLRSEWRGSHIADPHRELTLDRYEAEQEVTLPRRIPLDDFVAYSRWYQRRAVPEIDGRMVTRIDPDLVGFRLTLDDGDVVQAARVVVATGLGSFASRPQTFASTPPQLALHSSDLTNPARFAGARVAVIGAGQSALEGAALLHEAGAAVALIVRAPVVRWLSGHGWLRRYSGPFHKLIYPPGEVGPPGINWLIEFPNLFRRLPAERKRAYTTRALRPVGSAWLRPRLAGIPITTGRTVVAVDVAEDGLRLALDDGAEQEVDRVVLATGYRVDVDHYPFLAPDLARLVRRTNGSPDLTDGFESSVPGLHFVGAAAAASFGPLMRFVAGTGYTAGAVTCRVVQGTAMSRRNRAAGESPAS